MYRTYIARQAIMDREARTMGYELLFRDSPENKFPEIDPDIASSKLIVQNHIHGDIEAITMGKKAFINFTEQYLINKFPLLFDPKSIVIELIGHSTTNERLTKIIQFYHQRGYEIALSEYDMDEKWYSLFPYIDYVKVDIDKINPKRLIGTAKQFRDHNVKLVAEKVESKHQILSLVEVGFNFYQGYFYHEPEIVEGQTIAPMKAQMLNLMGEAFKSPLNFDAIADIISHDVQLSVGLLKMVNNVATGTRVEITSLKQAAAYLGEEKLRQFVSILALSKMSTEKTDEAAKQALITARLMDVLADTATFSSVKEYAFITGLLSAIEVLLGQSMEEIVKHMPLAENIELALLGRNGLLGELLILTTEYILGQNDQMNDKLSSYDINPSFMHERFVSASEWCKSLTEA
ncbi:EAL and HDOD domain-containing protein [Thalassotalea euphylliae]|uniref:EAL and HDOD domain-containing protein n=1 Tax=Thalassotalea euphylliae TaxID=1655234 RepID=UPI00364477CC